VAFMDVHVDKIVEYPTSFGSPGCRLLDELGICLYSNTQEKILHELQLGANDSKKLAICKAGNCGELLKLFQQGITPGNEHDPIILAEYKGKYWVGEGKHRVCVAKRFGIKQIKAKVTRLDADYYSTLPPIGTPGIFTATKIRYLKQYKVDGQYLYLWAGKPDNTMGGYITVKLNFCNIQNKPELWHQIFEGVSFCQNILPRQYGFFKKLLCGDHELLTSYVKIDKDHPLTKIWLARVTLSKGILQNSNRIEHLYRFGLWRKHHEKELLNSLSIDTT